MGKGAGPQRNLQLATARISLSGKCPFYWMSCKELATVTLAYWCYKLSKALPYHNRIACSHMHSIAWV